MQESAHEEALSPPQQLGPHAPRLLMASADHSVTVNPRWAMPRHLGGTLQQPVADDAEPQPELSVLFGSLDS